MPSLIVSINDLFRYFETQFVSLDSNPLLLFFTTQLQSISILAYLYEFIKIQGPHLIVVPKSTLSNWMNELNRWCPCLRVIRFHGNKEEREALGCRILYQ